ncbi:MAG: T9SS type A sorting domain-containing protein [Bacteroidetes bacterium]|nr:T9SS type A sorting domain-containing protein [Bacteroidota bacterium]
METGVDTLMDVGTNCIQLSNGEYLACGVANSVSTGYSAAYIVKTEMNGDTIWKKQFDFVPIIGGDIFTDLKELPDNSYILLGTMHDTLTTTAATFLTKIDTNGNLLWFKKYTHADNDQSAELEITSDNKIIILGNSSIDPNTVYNDILLIKTDLDGNLIWRKTFGTIFEEVYLSLEVIKNNTEYLLGGRYGYYNTGDPYFDFGIVRTDTAGNLIWRNEYGTPGGNEPSASATYTLDGGFAMSGRYNNQAALMKIDSAGVQQWIKYFTLGTTPYDWIASVKQLTDSSFVMIGSGEYGATTAWSGFLIKADKNGDLIWQRVYEGEPTIPNYFYGFNTTNDGGFIITGQYNHIGQPYQNLWLVKTDSLGCDSVSCSFSTAVEETAFGNLGVIIYPNPTTGLLNIKLENETTGLLKIEIYNLLGEKVYNKHITQNSININHLDNGVYFIQLTDKNNKHLVTQKLMLQK